MKIEWTILLITALTDFMLTFLTGLGTAMATNQHTGLPDWGTICVAAIGGGMVAFRTVQQALKANPITTAALKGEDPPVVVPAKAVDAVVVKEPTKP